MRLGFLQLLPDGPLLGITDDVHIGTAERCELRLLDSRHHARVHCRASVRDGEHWLEDLGSASGTFLERHGVMLGRIGRARLEHGDVIGLGERIRFTLEALPPDFVLERLAAAVAAAPDDEAAWLVYGDRLLERGDPLGRRIAQRRIGWDWPGSDVGEVLPSMLQLDWAFGHIRRAVVGRPRASPSGRPTFEDCVKTLIASPIARFLVELELPDVAGRADRLATVLAKSDLPALRSLRVDAPTHGLELPRSPYMNEITR